MRKEFFFFNFLQIHTIFKNKLTYQALPTKYLIRNYLIKNNKKTLIIIDNFSIFFNFKLLKKQKKSLRFKKKIKKSNFFFNVNSLEENTKINNNTKLAVELNNKLEIKPKKYKKFVINKNIGNFLNLTSVNYLTTPQFNFSFKYFKINKQNTKQLYLYNIINNLILLKNYSAKKQIVYTKNFKKGYNKIYNHGLIFFKKKKLKKKIKNIKNKSKAFNINLPIAINLNKKFIIKKNYIYLKKISTLNFHIKETFINKLHITNLKSNKLTELFVSESKIKKNNKNIITFNNYLNKIFLKKQKKKKLLKIVKLKYNKKKNKIIK